MMPTRTEVDHGVFTEERVEYSGIEEVIPALVDIVRRGRPDLGNIAQAVAYRRAVAESVLNEHGYSPTNSREKRKSKPGASAKERESDALMEQLFPVSWWWVPFDGPRSARAAAKVVRLGNDLLEHHSRGLDHAALLDALLLGEAWLSMLVVLGEPEIKKVKEAVATASDSARAKAVKRHGGEPGRLNREKRNDTFREWDKILRQERPDLTARRRAMAIAKHAAEWNWKGKNGAPLAVDTVLEILKGRR